MNRVIYTFDEVSSLTDDELLGSLANSWEIADDCLEVWGELPPLGNSTYCFLRNPRLISSGERLYYPLVGLEKEPCRFFVAPKDALKFGAKNNRAYIRCKLKLSPKSERIKHNNPFSLCVDEGTSEQLTLLPKEVPLKVLTTPDLDGGSAQFISKAIYDFYYDKALAQIQAEMTEKQEEFRKALSESNRQLQGIDEKRSSSIRVVEKLASKQVDYENLLEQLRVDKSAIQWEIESLKKRQTQIEAEMNNKVKRLKAYVSEKASFLKTFEFIDEEDLDSFLLEARPSETKVDGISFRGTINGDYRKAVSYIQSHLVQNDILYPRHIIENYITLLRTKDLIILAGESGSGKTNLVRSFAKAVGGKAVVVPVKPNWTSSEDLLGYYNPLEKKYLSTPFLDALIEAQQNPDVPYFICLDEMNLARVEYYFADFLSKLETRDEDPEITLYSENESSHVLSELKAVVEVIQSAKEKYQQGNVLNYIELLKDDDLNSQLRLAFGFSDKDSLIKYHSEIRRMLSSVMSMPSSIKMPANVHIIGAINIDETTHNLSPKILDRAHVMRFESPLLYDWNSIITEVEEYGFVDTSKPLLFDVESLGYRENYPKFDRNNPFCQLFIDLNKEFFYKLGIEFGMRAIRQGINYFEKFQDVNSDSNLAINNFLLHKVLPKMTFDGNKYVGQQTKLEITERVFSERVKQQLPDYENYDEPFSAVHALSKVVKNAKANDGVLNFWA
ncbi:MAG: AAA family ATPase [Alteromonas macleodii]|nr:AAA family ATPase [Alteromonas macleodii]